MTVDKSEEQDKVWMKKGCKERGRGKDRKIRKRRNRFKVELLGD